MRGALGPIVLVALLAGCGDASTSKIAPKGPGSSGADDDETTKSGNELLDEQQGGGTSSGDPDPVPTTSPDDEDGDGVANADDCDPKSKTLGRRLAEDTLGSDKGLFAAATGFPTASWSFGGVTAYSQTRLADASDVAFFSKEASVGDVQIEVTSASVEVGTFATKLRQIFVLVGASSNGTTFTAHACGIEVVGGESPEQKTSVVKLEGSPSGVTTTMLQRVTRPAVQANEEFTVKARLESGVLSCSVTQAGNVTTTASAGGLGTLTGNVGFFTRQTKAFFKNLRVCGLK